MTRTELILDFGRLLSSNDSSEIEMFLADDPDLGRDIEFLTAALNMALAWGNTAVVPLLVKQGANVNCAKYDGRSYCPILTRIWPETPFDLVKFAVDSGANINMIMPDFSNEGAFQTALSRAIMFGRKDIEMYLRSRGGKLPHELPDYSPPPPSVNIRPYIIQMTHAIREKDIHLAKRTIAECPEIITNQAEAAHVMHEAARSGFNSLLALLVDRGVDINIPHDEKLPERPIVPAVRAGSVETVRWLIDHGSEINYGWGGGPIFCSPLTDAIIDGRLDLVRMFVEAGAFLNVLDRRTLTPLSWAILYNRAEIADYLRSKGALEAQQIPGWVDPMIKGRVVNQVEMYFGPVEPLAWVPIIPDETHVALRTANNGETFCVFTEGISAQPMNVPPGEENFRFAELVMYLFEWPQEREKWRQPEYLWPVNWMRRIANYPFENNTWLGGMQTIIANNEPPEPLGPGTEMTCWLLLGEKSPMERFEMPDGKSVMFYTMIPIHTAERDFEREHGMVALLEKFAEVDMPDFIDPKRKSLV